MWGPGTHGPVTSFPELPGAAPSASGRGPGKVGALRAAWLGSRHRARPAPAAPGPLRAAAPAPHGGEAHTARPGRTAGGIRSPTAAPGPPPLRHGPPTAAGEAPAAERGERGDPAGERPRPGRGGRCRGFPAAPRGRAAAHAILRRGETREPFPRRRRAAQPSPALRAEPAGTAPGGAGGGAGFGPRYLPGRAGGGPGPRAAPRPSPPSCPGLKLTPRDVRAPPRDLYRPPAARGAGRGPGGASRGLRREGGGAEGAGGVRATRGWGRRETNGEIQTDRDVHIHTHVYIYTQTETLTCTQAQLPGPRCGLGVSLTAPHPAPRSHGAAGLQRGSAVEAPGPHRAQHLLRLRIPRGSLTPRPQRPAQPDRHPCAGWWPPPPSPCWALASHFHLCWGPWGQPGEPQHRSAFPAVTPAPHSSTAAALGLETRRRTALHQNKPHSFPRNQTFLLFLGFARVLFLSNQTDLASSF